MSKGIYSRGYLPHWDFPNSVQGITFRLADSVPQPIIQTWIKELAALAPEASSKELHRLISQYEDQGHGACLLREPACAAVVRQKLFSGHGEGYRLLAWVIMPNHVHVLIHLDPKSSLPDIIRTWKGSSAIEINRLKNRQGQLWYREFYDRFIRDENHLHDAIAYIHNNPVKAGLCATPEAWPFSSASHPNGPLASAGENI